MRLRRTLNYHSLKKGRVRQTWNKHNLFNLGRVSRTIPNFITRTFFQQKWAAKALTRAYHGEHVKERKWERMFSRRLLSVVNMDPEYMAHHDGSEQAAGRGSGKDPYTELDQLPWGNRQSARDIRGSILKRQDVFDENEAVIQEYGQDLKANKQLSNRGQTPYMNMTYAPLERRIDVAIHRALFASSTRQARQFVVHGAVKVNGQVMRHPNYLLNPGDMFQVNTDSVLYATGKRRTGLLREPKSWNVTSGKAKEQAEEEVEEAEEEVEEEAEAEEKAAEEAAEATAGEPTDAERANKQLKFLSRIARKILADDKYKLKANKKRDLRQFLKEAREAMSRMGRKDAEEMASVDLVNTINDMLKELALQNGRVVEQAKQSRAFSAKATDDAKKAADEASAEKKAKSTPASEQEPKKESKRSSWQFHLEEAELAAMKREVKGFEDHPYDPSKPYHTPWQPRPYMSAFAFIPRYLEVNQNICAAVYLRHPVARRNLAEVPSPFPPNVMQLAFNWYLRRR